MVPSFLYFEFEFLFEGELKSAPRPVLLKFFCFSKIYYNFYFDNCTTIVCTIKVTNGKKLKPANQH